MNLRKWQEREFRFRQFYIPERMRSSIDLYVNHYISPGHFLTAVLSNDLKEACARADDENMQNLPAYVAFFYNHAPSNCWGSRENVKLWLSKRKVQNANLS